MLRLRFLTLPSATAATIDPVWGLLGRLQSQTVGSLDGPVIFGATWNGTPTAGLAGCPVTGTPGVRNHGLLGGLGSGLGELPNVPH